MLIKLLFPLLIFYSSFANASAYADILEVAAPDVTIIENNIIVNSRIDNVKEFEAAIRSGVAKEIIFRIELIRAWRFWPDEFVVSMKIKRVVKYDSLREQYHLSSDDGKSLIVRQFKDFDMIKESIFAVEAVEIANIRELDPGIYYVRVVVETRNAEEPSVFGLLMYLIPEVEMRVKKESRSFRVRGGE